MKITKKWLEKHNACESGRSWFQNQTKTEGITVVRALIEDRHNDWANWTIVRLMTHKQKVKYAVFAAEQVIESYEKEYPDDMRPRRAIEAAKRWIKNPSDKNKEAANAAANAAAYAAANAATYATANAAYAAANAAAYATVDAAYAAANAANATVDAASAAANAAYAAANAASAAANTAYAAANAANATVDAAYAASEALQIKILNFGIKLLKPHTRGDH